VTGPQLDLSEVYPSEGQAMTVLEYIPVRRRVQVLDDGDRMKAAMESLVEKQDPWFKITLILIGLVILYGASLPLTYV
jgi:hypothetical protein